MGKEWFALVFSPCAHTVKKQNKTKQNKLTTKHNQKNTVRTSQMEILLLISRLKRHGNQMREERCEQELKKKKKEMILA